MKIALDAKTLRIVLIVSMFLLATGAVAGFIFARNQLQAFASSINQMEADAASVDNNVEALKELEITLKGMQDIKAKTDSIAVPASDYPVAVIANITAIANQAGITLTSISYGDSSNTTQTTPGTGTPASGSSTNPSTESTGTSASGMTKKTINVVTESPVNYDKLMNFIKGIETDDTYMHIAQISLSRADGNSVTTQPFTIEVYVR